MTLRELRCPSCGAPVKSAASELACQFCSARLVRADAPAPEMEALYGLSVSVAPSNRARVTQLLQERLGLTPADATARVEGGAFELDLARDKQGARALLNALEEAGASAKLDVRQVPIPLADVVLEHPGAKPLAVIVVLRSELELSIPDTKALISRAPVVVAAALKLEQAHAFVDRLTQAGARARLG